MKTAFRIAFRHLGFKRQGSYTSFAGLTAMIGLGLGICALVLTISVLNGFEDTISRKIAGLDGHIRIQHFLFKPVIPYQARLDSALNQEKIQFNSLAYIQEAAMVRKRSQAEGILVEGYQNELPKRIAKLIRKGSPKLLSGSAAIGMELANILKVDIGDKLVLVDMKSMISISSAQRLKQVTITGIYKSGLQEYDKSVVYISLINAQELFDYGNKISGYSISLQNGQKCRISGNPN